MSNKDLFSTKKTLALSLGLSIFLLTKPVLVWGRVWLYLIPVAPILFFGIFHIKRKININLILNYFFSLSLFLIIWLPLREHDTPSFFFFVVFFVSLTSILLSDSIINNAINHYVNLMLIVAGCAIATSLALTLSLPFPTIQISNEARTDIFYWYYFSLILDSQNFNISGLSLSRAVGWFQEPGHFAIYLSIALIFCLERNNKKQNLILIIGLIITFSTTAYILLFIIFIINSKNLKEKLLLLIPLILITILYYLFEPIHEIINKIFLDKIMTSNNTGNSLISALEARSRAGDTFGVWPSINDYIFGLGSGYFDYIQIVLSDYRRLIISSGYISFISICIFFIFMILISIKKKEHISLSILILFFVTLTHRSWFFYQGLIWILVNIILIRLFQNGSKKTKIQFKQKGLNHENSFTL